MLFIDNPIGVGMSPYEDEFDIPTNENDVAI